MADAIISEETKVCTKCKARKSLSDFSRDTTTKSGRRSSCKVCVSIYTASRYEKSKDVLKARTQEWRAKNTKHIKEYRANYYKENRENLLIVGAVWREENREKSRLSSRNWAKENPDKVKELQKSWQMRNKEKISELGKKYRAVNRDKLILKNRLWKERNKDRVKKYQSIWSSSNPELTRYYNQKRRAQKIGADGSISKELKSKLEILQKGKCACCKKKLGGDFHMDHIYPLSKGGSHSDNNIQLLCAVCNLQKHAKDPIEFMQEKGYLL